MADLSVQTRRPRGGEVKRVVELLRSFGASSQPPPRPPGVNPTVEEARNVIAGTRNARRALRDAQLRLRATGEYPFAIILPPANDGEEGAPEV